MGIESGLEEGITGLGTVVDVDSMDFDNAQVTYDEDGSALLELDPTDEELEDERLKLLEDAGHFDNMAHYLDSDDLAAIGSSLSAEIEADFEAKEEWNKTYADGLRLLGIRVEDDNADPGTKPFEGSSDEVHPLLTEAVVRFQAQAYKELIPADGPVTSKVVGLETPEKLAQAGRVKEYLNYLVMQKMPEFEPDFDQMLFMLPLAGSQFRKVSYDAVKGRPVDMTVLAENFAVNPDATDIITSRRATMRTQMSLAQIDEMQSIDDAGAWIVPEQIISSGVEQSETDEVYDDITGIDTSDLSSELVTIYECHAQLVVEELDMREQPYIITITDGGQILALSRNWDEDDATQTKREYYVHYKFMPGLGFYGFGYVHILGQLARGSTSLLRQLIDAGVLSNLPAGFKSRGFRMDRESDPLTPGEFREVDTGDLPINQAIMPLPYNEPSGTLLALMKELVGSAQRLASMTDMNTGDGNAEMPVGTTVALLERSNMTQSAIHKRLYCAQKQELKLLARTTSENMPEGGYPYEVKGDPVALMRADFDDRVDVIPVADPDMFSMSQRIALAQTRLQMAQQAPQLHDLRAAYRAMYEAMNVKNIDQVLPPEEKLEPKDPLSENMDTLQGKPLKAFMDQDHESHIRAHMALMQNPQFADNGEMLQAVKAHIYEHQAMLMRIQVEQAIGQPLPANLSELPPEQAAQVAAQIAQATQQVTGQAQAMAKAQAQAQQPSVQERIAAVQENEVQRKAIKDKMDNDREIALKGAELQAEGEKFAVKSMIDLERVESSSRNNSTSNAVSLAISEQRHGLDADKLVTDNVRLLHELNKGKDDSEKAALSKGSDDIEEEKPDA